MTGSVDESTQIRNSRVPCIFFMMSVHVNPGLHTASVISTGSFAGLGAIWVDLLGRASVAALSFISGYLLIRTASGRTLTTVARRRFQTLIIPMLTVRFLRLCILQIGKVVISGEADDSILLRLGQRSPRRPDGADRAASERCSPFFLRDLVVTPRFSFRPSGRS